jgi:hypothetical protein
LSALNGVAGSFAEHVPVVVITGYWSEVEILQEMRRRREFVCMCACVWLCDCVWILVLLISLTCGIRISNDHRPKRMSSLTPYIRRLQYPKTNVQIDCCCKHNCTHFLPISNSFNLKWLIKCMTSCTNDTLPFFCLRTVK